MRYFRRLAKVLDDDTIIYTGHEYALRNVAFDTYFFNAHLKVYNEDSFQQFYDVWEKRQNNEPVLTTWGTELKCNPFVIFFFLSLGILFLVFLGT